MPRTSRSKSHKQSKHSSKDTVREYSGSDEDVKVKEKSSNNGKEDVVSVRVSGERRKHSKDLLKDVSKDLSNGGGSEDRWNGGGSSDDKGLGVGIEDKELVKSSSKSGKSSRRHDGDSVSVVELEKDVSRGEKRKSEKETGRKESGQYKEHKEYKEAKDKDKEKDRGSDRGRKGHSEKVEVEALTKQVENHSSKRGKEISGE